MGKYQDFVGISRNVVKYGKYSLAKFAYFVYMFVLRAEIVTIFERKMVTISARNTTLQGYIFQVLYHFATKFCNFTNFIMFFLAVVFDSLLFT
jgi:hypothetical protein